MLTITRGRLRARLAGGPEDLARAQALRHLCFRGTPGIDADAHDALCDHVLVEEVAGGALLCCFRVMALDDAAALDASYSARFYDLSPLAAVAGPMVEMGRFCIAPGQADPDIPRLAWGAMTRLVDARGVRLMFGCTSFQRADPALHAAALAVLRPHVAPPDRRPAERAAELVRLADLPAPADPRAAMAALPPLLRTYLAMGGWVSDHAVIDRDLDTLHVFTAVEVERVPPARTRALRALAG